MEEDSLIMISCQQKKGGQGDGVVAVALLAIFAGVGGFNHHLLDFRSRELKAPRPLRRVADGLQAMSRLYPLYQT
jgi:hypothetical protein